MTIDMSQFYQVFFEEAGENLATMEGLLLELDVDAPDLETLNAIFRAAHSMKGGAGTFGFNDMARVTHVLETLLDRLRKQELAPTVEMVDAFLQAGDVLKSQLAAHQEGTEYEAPRVAEVCAHLEVLASLDDTSGEGLASPVRDTGVRESLEGGGWRIEFRPADIGRRDGLELQGLFDALGELGTIEGTVPSDLDGAREMDVCVWRLFGDVGRGAVEEIFAFICEPNQVSLAAIQPDESSLSAEPDESDDDGYGFFMGAPGSEFALDQELDGFGLFGGSPGMDQVVELANQDRLDRDLGYGFFDASPGFPEPNGEARRESPAQTVAAQPKRSVDAGGSRATAAPKRAIAADTSIRVSVEKVDQLINLVGELVITHAMLAESATVLDPALHERIFGGLSNLERNSRDLQQAVMSIRMMPISFVFNRFPRVVRDTAASLGKKVLLRLVGEDTELDKGLIERMADPLNHLVRNSIDHGIEQPEARRAAGKPEQGEITLRASHRGGSVVVEVSDDGAGLNREKLLAKAAKQGIPMPDNPSDKEVWALIFHAGFSTAERVTDISGRGVGMDVVRRNIEDMNGRVEIESSPGRGTHITIRLPLTLAILDGLSVRMGEEIFILPLTVIQESIQPKPEQFKSVVGKGRVALVNGEYLPMVSLRDVFNSGGPETRPEDGILVIVDTNEGRAAVLVDELVAQHQVVIKSLETNYRKVDGVSGATIMGDGRVALILDVDALVRLNRRATRGSVRPIQFSVTGDPNDE
ncbi:chemotaxis protein CheW [Thiocystis violacea]|uniref:chemotaxis protein CheW n=1 Tax=Thiocystis violacea TaxID=13725 RepID=UPI001908EA5D|nr:chemotaxis protein CheW [Thiocystis violacea]MBK1717871.1 chemotaxis protein CheA [Thiocystis violacea]